MRSRSLAGSVCSLVVAGALSAACASSADQPVANAAPDSPISGPQGRVAQFIAECGVSHFAFDDPIVHPGHVGASHQHVFFGNTEVTATSTYDDLVGAATTCDQPLDTASYWTPVLLDADGQRVEPTGAVAYYRPGLGVDPATLVPYPPDLKLVAGDSAAVGPQPLSVVAWSCGVSAVRSVMPTSCPARSTLRLMVTFPDCWDGERTRVPDPRDLDDRHAVYSSAGQCPDSHPVAIPQLQLVVDHPPVDPDGLGLSSGPITSGHADFWNAWDQQKLVTEVEGCLHRGITCGVTAN
ncbi:DUF1996 domain-containing protein [soil metagenome]